MNYIISSRDRRFISEKHRIMDLEVGWNTAKKQLLKHIQHRWEQAVDRYSSDPFFSHN